MEVENDASIARINRVDFVLRKDGEAFDIANRKQLDGLDKTLIRS
jgi:hypothetical protein